MSHLFSLNLTIASFSHYRRTLVSAWAATVTLMSPPARAPNLSQNFLPRPGNRPNYGLLPKLFL